MSKTYAIIGCGGCFGIQTAEYLLKHANPKKVIGIGRNPLPAEPFSLGIDKMDGFEYRALHITYEFDMLMRFLDKEKPDIIINYAAQGESATSWEDSWRYYEANSVALAKLAEELGKRDWLERFIQIGTSEVYGSVNHAVSENEPIKPTSPYAASKVAFDMHLESAFRFLKFPMNILRPSNAYCPAQRLHRVIPKAIMCGLKGIKLPLQAGGRPEKSYIHARDLARAIHMVAEKGTLGKTYNVGPENPTSIRKVVELTAEAMNIPFEQLCVVTEDRLGQDARYWLDSSAIRKDLGWEPQIEWKEGLTEMVEWAKRYFDQLKDVKMEYILRG